MSASTNVYPSLDFPHASRPKTQLVSSSWSHFTTGSKIHRLLCDTRCAWWPAPTRRTQDTQGRHQLCRVRSRDRCHDVPRECRGATVPRKRSVEIMQTKKIQSLCNESLTDCMFHYVPHHQRRLEIFDPTHLSHRS